MVYLVLAILCSVTIANMLHLFSEKKANILVVFAGNYLVAAAFSAAANRLPLVAISKIDVGFGVLVGTLFLFNFVLYQQNIKRNGISLSSGAMRFSLVIPTLVSILLFNETILPIQTFGMAIVLLSFIFLTKGGSLHSILWLLSLFLFTGLTDTAIRTYKQIGSHESLFMVILFVTALIANLYWVFHKKTKFDRKSFIYGLALGIPNMLTTKFFLKSLDTVKAPVAYPVFSAGIMFLCIISEIFFWKTKYLLRQKLALVLMLIGIVLINLNN